MSVLTKLKKEASKFKLASGGLDSGTEESDMDDSDWDDKGVEVGTEVADKGCWGVDGLEGGGIDILGRKGNAPQRLQEKLKTLFESMQMVSLGGRSYRGPLGTNQSDIMVPIRWHECSPVLLFAGELMQCYTESSKENWFLSGVYLFLALEGVGNQFLRKAYTF